MSDFIEIGKGKAIIFCSNCGTVLGCWYNAQENQELLYDVTCVHCDKQDYTNN